MAQGRAQALVPGQVVHTPDQDQSQGQDQNPGRDQGLVSDLHLDQNHHSPLNKYVFA